MKGTHIVTPSVPKKKTLSWIKDDAIQAAKEIGYDIDVIEKLSKATGQGEINRILMAARHKWDVNPNRWDKSGNYVSSTQIESFELCH